MTKKRFCLCECGEVLTGKQKMFHSDACRMRFNREHKKSEQNRSGMFANRSVLTEREVTIELSVLVVLSVIGAKDLDEMWLNKPIQAKMGRFLAVWLADQYPEAKILAVKVEKKP
jgi:hypothetical protein